MRNRSLIITLIFGLVLIVCFTSCSGERVVGTYTNPDKPDDYLELHKDGTFYSREMGVGFTGEWEREEDVLRFHLSDLGMTIEAKFEDAKIIFDHGFEGGREVWTRESRSLQETGTLKESLVSRWWKKLPRPGYPGGIIIQFGKDGTLYELDPETGQKTQAGSYHFVDEDTIHATVDGESVTADVRITDGSLFLSGSGFTDEYEEVSPQTSSRATGGDGMSMPKSAGKWLVSAIFGLVILVTAGLMGRSLRRLA